MGQRIFLTAAALLLYCSHLIHVNSSARNQTTCTVTDHSITPVSLSWCDDANNTNNYLVNVSITDGCYKCGNGGFNVSSCNTTFYDLCPKEKYTFEVMDREDDDGMVICETTTTGEGAKPNKPENLAVTDITFSNVTVSWENPRCVRRNRTTYTMTVCTRDNKCLPPEQIEVTEVEKPLSRTTSNLNAFMNYYVQVKAIEGKDASEEATEFFQTAVSHPGAPSNVSADPKSSSVVELRWTKPGNPNGPIDGYGVECHPIADSCNSPLGSQDTLLNLTDLKPYTKYTFYIWALNNVANGKPLIGNRSTTSTTTFVSAPEQPASLNCTSESHEAVQLEWNRPSTPNGPIDGFYVTCNSSLTVCQGTNSLRNSSILVDGLDPYTSYTFTVWAYNRDEQGHILNGSAVTFGYSGLLQLTSMLLLSGRAGTYSQRVSCKVYRQDRPVESW